jgi:hypothetical protein
MVPGVRWDAAVESFGESTGPQVILCATCVILLGLTTPPRQVVIHNGSSTCLDHLLRRDTP